MLEGSCHCGQVKWSYLAKLESVTACNCTLCSRYGALWAYGYLGEAVQISGATKSYERDRKLNGFHFCEICGCVGYYLSRGLDQDGRRRIAVNLRLTVNPALILDLPVDHFEGREKFIDLPNDGRHVHDLWF